MIGNRRHNIVKFLTDPHSPNVTVSSFASAACKAIDITHNDNFATTLEQHVIVDMKTTVQTASVDSNIPAWCWGIPLHKAKRMVQEYTCCETWKVRITRE